MCPFQTYQSLFYRLKLYFFLDFGERGIIVHFVTAVLPLLTKQDRWLAVASATNEHTKVYNANGNVN